MPGFHCLSCPSPADTPLRSPTGSNESSIVGLLLATPQRPSPPLFTEEGPGSDSRCDLPESQSSRAAGTRPRAFCCWAPSTSRGGQRRRGSGRSGSEPSHTHVDTHTHALCFCGVVSRLGRGSGKAWASGEPRCPRTPLSWLRGSAAPQVLRDGRTAGPRVACGEDSASAESSPTWEPASSKYTGLCQQRTGFCGNGGAQLRLPGAPATQRLPCQVCGSRPPAASAHGWACRSHTAWPRPDGQLSLLRTPGLP